MDDTLKLLLILIPALPLAGAILAALLGPRLLKSQSHWPVLLGIVGSCICSLLLIAEVRQQQAALESEHGGHEHVEQLPSFQRVYALWTWADVEGAYTPSGQASQASQNAVAAGDAAASLPFRIQITLRADALTAMMLGMVTFISSLVALFAAGYMHGDRGYWRFFAYIGLFVFSMTMLVSVSNFVLLYVFWEAVGACSYLLIGFWYQKKEASAAGKKAFLVNRVGDFGFALALFLIWTYYGTLDFHDSNAAGPVAAVASAEVEGDAASASVAGPVVSGVLGESRIEQQAYVGGGIGLAICLLLMLGACGKSAQFPLHVWLPDAMEGPTPVSALIHAATMVTAGVYMVTRCTPLFMASPDAQLVVACIGAFTALLAGLIALTQYDLKRVLAYSTVSQLGYMFLGVGTGLLSGVTAGMFHLFTHAFFKALLFLGAGSVMHAMGNVIDMRRFGGLRRLMPITHWTFLIGCLALAGVWPLSGFWSKDAILASVHEKVESLAPVADTAAGEALEQRGAETGHAAEAATASVFGLTQVQRANVYQVLMWMAVFTAFLTAFYTFRAFFMTFYGEEKVPPEAGHHAHESPPTMWVPLAVLAVCAFFVGMYFEVFTHHAFAHFLGHTPSLALGAIAETATPHEFHITVAAISTLVAAAGIFIALYLYLGHDRELKSLTSIMRAPWMGRNLSPYQLSHNKFYFDEIYYVLAVKPLEILAGISYWFDRWIIDGLVNFTGRIPPAFGALMRSLQMGLVQFYALAMVLGVLILLAARWMWVVP